MVLWLYVSKSHEKMVYDHHNFLQKMHLSEKFPTHTSNSIAQNVLSDWQSPPPHHLSPAVFIFQNLPKTKSTITVRVSFTSWNTFKVTNNHVIPSRSPSNHVIMFCPRPPSWWSQVMSQARCPQLFSAQTSAGSLTFAASVVNGVGSSLMGQKTEDFFIKHIMLCSAKMGGLKEMVRKEVAPHACRNLCCLFSLQIPWRNFTGRAQIPTVAQPALSEQQHPLHPPACTAQPIPPHTHLERPEHPCLKPPDAISWLESLI